MLGSLWSPSAFWSSWAGCGMRSCGTFFFFFFCLCLLIPVEAAKATPLGTVVTIKISLLGLQGQSASLVFCQKDSAKAECRNKPSWPPCIHSPLPSFAVSLCWIATLRGLLVPHPSLFMPGACLMKPHWCCSGLAAGNLQRVPRAIKKKKKKNKRNCSLAI